MAGASSSYTAVNTHIASARARCETQAPLSTKASAAATCASSSRVISRTSTLVSMARTARFHIAPQPGLHLLDGSGIWGPFREQCAVDVLEAVTSGPGHDYLLAFLVPLHDRAGRNPSLRRTSAGTEIWPCAVFSNGLWSWPAHYHGNAIAANLS